jgi:hypothetical protein
MCLQRFRQIEMRTVRWHMVMMIVSVEAVMECRSLKIIANY